MRHFLLFCCNWAQELSAPHPTISTVPHWSSQRHSFYTTDSIDSIGCKRTKRNSVLCDINCTLKDLLTKLTKTLNVSGNDRAIISLTVMLNDDVTKLADMNIQYCLKITNPVKYESPYTYKAIYIKSAENIHKTQPNRQTKRACKQTQHNALQKALQKERMTMELFKEDTSLWNSSKS